MVETTKRSQQELRARELFGESIEQLDARTRSRLNQARHAALEEFERGRHSTRWRRWVSAGALVSLGLIGVVFWARPAMSPDAQLQISGETATEAVELVLAGEDLDLVIDGLDFYLWLEESALPETEELG